MIRSNVAMRVGAAPALSIGRFGRLVALSCTGALLGIALLGVHATAQSVTKSEVDRAAEARSQYGFDGGWSYVRNLASKRTHPASDEYGFPMTAAEAKDLLGRSTFVQRLDQNTLVAVRALDGYAGEWIDQKDGGRLVVGLTDPRPRIKGHVRQLMPAVSRGVSFEVVNDSAKALDSALRRAEAAWDELESGIRPQAFAIHYRYNRITVKVRQQQLDAARSFTVRLKAKLGVDVGFAASPPITDLAPASACSSRVRCYGPFRLGARINFPKSYPDPGITSYCGMGFHITDPASGGQGNTFMTAGHCTYQREGPWQHHDDYKARYGRIGARVSTRYTSAKRDIALIEIEDWNANKTTRIYGDDGWSDGATLTGEGRVIEGETLCVSLAQKDRVLCGTADSTLQSWTSTTADPDIKVWGAAFDLPNNPGGAPIPGDSGSPIYRRWTTSTVPGSPRRTPIGIVNAGSSDTPHQQEEHSIYFATVWWALHDPDGWPALEIYIAPPPPLAKRAFTATWIGAGRSDHRTSFAARPVEGATSYGWDFGDGSKARFGRQINHEYANAGEYDVKLSVSFPGGHMRTRTIRIAANPARTYAPLVYLHPAEELRPISAATYIEHSRLMFAHDEGCEPSLIEPGVVSADKLGSGGYEAELADDADCGLVPPPYSSNQNTRPGDPGNVFPVDERAEGFYLDLDDDWRAGTKLADDPAYYEFKAGRYVIYWFLYAYNDHGNSHEGDWEHITVRIDDTGLAEQFAYYRHACTPKIFGRSSMNRGFGQPNTGFYGKTHPIVYSAKGSHASYWKRRPSWTIGKGCGLPLPFEADRTQKGAAWQTWMTLTNVRTGWYGYGGAWGSAGAMVAGTRINDGSLGPSRHVRSSAVPGW